MRIGKRVSLFYLLMVLWTMVHAQNPYDQSVTDEERATWFIKGLQVRVPFSKVKRDSLITVYQSFFEDIKTYRVEGSPQAMKALEGKRDQQVQGILSAPGQYDAYLQYVEDLKKRQKKLQMIEGGKTE